MKAGFVCLSRNLEILDRPSSKDTCGPASNDLRPINWILPPSGAPTCPLANSTRPVRAARLDPVLQI